MNNENRDNFKIIQNLCKALDEFGTEEERRKRYIGTYRKFAEITDVRQLYNDILQIPIKSPLRLRLDYIISKNRDIILDFIKNANRGNIDESFEEPD